ncbi:MAG: PIG-L deacetylase family protein [Nanoarchaeota archaeon]
MVKTVIVFVAHSDDESVGCIGTLIKLKEQDYKIIKVIFSAGQKSHPHYIEEFVIKQRIKETEGLGKRFGISQNIYFGLKDNKLKQEIIEKNIKERIRRILKKYKPRKVFLNSALDPHPDHRAVNKAVLNVIDDLNYKGDVYEYEVWNILKENKPIVYEDITPYFKAKIAMMKSYKSQWLFMYPLIIVAYVRAKIYGIKNNCKYAEKFYKIK